MQIIPVIDLKNGRVVHAHQGNRQSYQPVQSYLSSSSLIEEVIEGFFKLFPFKKMYIADLDAIEQNGNHKAMINSVIKQYPEIEFWVDYGAQLSSVSAQEKQPNKIIIGSESQITAQKIPDSSCILSLDFKDQQALGPQQFFEDPTLWPDYIIIMTLSRVGNFDGPDLEKLKHFKRQYPEKHFVAAGGIRGFEDLSILRNLGVNHALVASCLHSGSLTQQQIKTLQQKKYPD